MPDVNITDNRKSCPYQGDGAAGVGELLVGLASAYLKEEIKTKTVQEIIENVHTVNDIDEDIIEDIERHIEHLTPSQKECLRRYLDTACTRYSETEYNKEDAIKDVKEAIDKIFNDYEREYLPVLYSRQCELGIYNDTTTELLANDAYAKTIIKAAELQLKTIKDYNEIQGLHGKQVTDGLNVALGDITDDDTHRVFDRDQLTDDERDTDRNTTTEENRDLSRRPDVEQFAVDSLAMIAGMLILELFAKSLYESCNA